jgi:hypothetical protein
MSARNVTKVFVSQKSGAIFSASLVIALEELASEYDLIADLSADVTTIEVNGSCEQLKSFTITIWHSYSQLQVLCSECETPFYDLLCCVAERDRPRRVTYYNSNLTRNADRW